MQNLLRPLIYVLAFVAVVGSFRLSAAFCSHPGTVRAG